MNNSKTPRLPSGQIPAGLPEVLDGTPREIEKKPRNNSRRGRSRTNLKPEDEQFEVFKGP